MSDETEYTPTTEEVREDYVDGVTGRAAPPERDHRATFDRWLAKHDREVAEKALEAAARLCDLRGLPALAHSIRALSSSTSLNDNPYRVGAEQ